MNNTIKIEENKIIIKTFIDNEYKIEIWEPSNTPSYFLGQQFFDFEGDRYFLREKKK